MHAKCSMKLTVKLNAVGKAHCYNWFNFFLSCWNLAKKYSSLPMTNAQFAGGVWWKTTGMAWKVQLGDFVARQRFGSHCFDNHQNNKKARLRNLTPSKLGTGWLPPLCKIRTCFKTAALFESRHAAKWQAEWVATKEIEFYHEGIRKLSQIWSACLTTQGIYFD